MGDDDHIEIGVESDTVCILGTEWETDDLHVVDTDNPDWRDAGGHGAMDYVALAPDGASHGSSWNSNDFAPDEVSDDIVVSWFFYGQDFGGDVDQYLVDYETVREELLNDD